MSTAWRPELGADAAHRGYLSRLVQGRSQTGLLLGWLALLISFAPSLLPRPWYVQAAASAVSVLLAYAVGALIGSLVAAAGRWLGVAVVIKDRRHRERVHWVVGLLELLTTVVLWFAGYEGRRHGARLVGLPAPSVWSDVLALIAAIALAVILLGLVWTVRAAFRASRSMFSTALPKPIAGILAFSLVAVTGTWLTRSVIAARGLDMLSSYAASVNDSTPENLRAPTSRLVSGGPGSTQAWSDLGREGEIYTANTPSASLLSELSGSRAIQPIRLYAAPESRSVDVDQLVDTIATEIRRTGALDRKYVNVVGTTGSGWVDEYNVRSLETLTGGDVATVAVQYSYLPSVAQFLTNRTLPAQVGKELVQRVRTMIAARPAGERPKLLLSGESLGALSTEAAFSDGKQVLSSVDGALWSGTPNSTPLWRSLTASRQQGSPQIAPVIDNGAHFRFAGTVHQIDKDAYGRPLGSWQTPRVLFMQHPSDPIVWWDPSLIYSRPAWLREPAGVDVDKNLAWYPFVTFWLTTVDLVSANSAPGGHGHRYRGQLVNGWAGVLGVKLQAGEKQRIVDSVEAAAELTS